MNLTCPDCGVTGEHRVLPWQSDRGVWGALSTMCVHCARVTLLTIAEGYVLSPSDPEEEEDLTEFKDEMPKAGRPQFTAERASPDTFYLKPANLHAERFLKMIVESAQVASDEQLIVEILQVHLVGRRDRDVALRSDAGERVNDSESRS